MTMRFFCLGGVEGVFAKAFSEATCRMRRRGADETSLGRDGCCGAMQFSASGESTVDESTAAMLTRVTRTGWRCNQAADGESSATVDCFVFTGKSARPVRAFRRRAARQDICGGCGGCVLAKHERVKDDVSVRLPQQQSRPRLRVYEQPKKGTNSRKGGTNSRKRVPHIYRTPYRHRRRRHRPQATVGGPSSRCAATGCRPIGRAIVFIIGDASAGSSGQYNAPRSTVEEARATVGTAALARALGAM